MDYDYIIVGGGSAGCALANRLSEQKENKVLLLEAGKSSHPLSRLPISFAMLVDNPSANWRYRSEPEEGTSNRQIPVPRGKLLGGSSSINGLVYVRGQKLDYDIWAQMGNKGWSFHDVQPFFKKLENYQNDCDDIRGTDGPVKISEVNERNPIFDALFKTGKNMGVPDNKDYNSGDQEGFCYAQSTIFSGLRISAKVAYLDPIKSRTNLSVKTSALVSKIIIKNNSAKGVEVLFKGKKENIFANNEIIVCGGAINSPQILELSGIGNPRVLKKVGISVVKELNGVGENLRDHIGVRQVYNVTKPNLSYNERARGVNLIKQAFLYVFKRDGFLALPSAPVLGFLKTKPELSGPDIQVHFIPYRLVLKNGKRSLGRDPGITCTINQSRPESQGSVHIISPNPEDHPAIKFNFLSKSSDRECLVEGVKLIRKIMNSDELKEYCEEELKNCRNFSSDEDILQFIRENAESIYHASGTCKMGNDKMAVVDNKLKVHGINNLRVADASIMPTLISGNTNAVCMMIGERCADFILNGN